MSALCQKQTLSKLFDHLVGELLEELPRHFPGSPRGGRPCWVAMPRAGSPHGKPVLQTSLGPQGVQSARNLQWRALPDIALEDFAVIADRLYDPVRPIIGEAERLPELALDTEQTAHIGRIEFKHLVEFVE